MAEVIRRALDVDSAAGTDASAALAATFGADPPSTRPTATNELLAQRGLSEPMSDADFARIRKKAAARHKATADRLGAASRRR
ncbi:MAG TPA: hypothetical protein VGJ03_04145 [Acidimicrobiales bacterium]|jgi:hypothetical protein